MASRKDFLAQFTTTPEAMAFEASILSAGDEFLTAEEIAVRDGEIDEPGPEYWDGLIAALKAQDDLDAVNRYNSGADELEPDHGTLYLYSTGEELRPATAEEAAESAAAVAEEIGGCNGAIEVDGFGVCYVA